MYAGASVGDIGNGLEFALWSALAALHALTHIPDKKCPTYRNSDPSERVQNIHEYARSRTFFQPLENPAHRCPSY